MLFYSIRKDASQKAWQDQQMLKKTIFSMNYYYQLIHRSMLRIKQTACGFFQQLCMLTLCVFVDASPKVTRFIDWFTIWNGHRNFFGPQLSLGIFSDCVWDARWLLE